jgi:hypothetical protein
VRVGAAVWGIGNQVRSRQEGDFGHVPCASSRLTCAWLSPGL